MRERPARPQVGGEDVLERIARHERTQFVRVDLLEVDRRRDEVAVERQARRLLDADEGPGQDTVDAHRVSVLRRDEHAPVDVTAPLARDRQPARAE